jgi:Ras-related protein Rab-28
MSASAPSRPLKLLLVGNGSAGKTSLCTRFRTDGFARVYKQTVGVDFYEKATTVRGAPVTLQVWDIGGQSIGSAMLPQYMGGAAAALLVFDTTDAASFADAGDWLRALRAGGGPRDVFLLGNKADLTGLRAVSPERAGAWAAANGVAGVFFVSARTGEGVATAFASAAAAALGLTLSAEEVALTVRVLGVTVDAPGGADDARVAGADDVEREDRLAAEARARREASCCGDACAVV